MRYIKTIETYCFSCKKYAPNKVSSVRKTKQSILMLLSNYAACGKKKSTFIKSKETSNNQFKKNKIINKVVLTGDKFMPKLHLKQPGFIYSACGPFTKTGKLKYLYRNELDKACFTHNATYSESKHLAKRTISDKILKDRAYDIVRNRGYDAYQRTLASMVQKFFDKKTGSRLIVNEQLAKESHKLVIKKFTRKKVYPRFKDNIWGADLTEMGSLSSKNKNVEYLLCVIDVFTNMHGLNL